MAPSDPYVTVAPDPHHCWFQFSLKTMFVVVTLLSLFSTWLAIELHRKAVPSRRNQLRHILIAMQNYFDVHGSFPYHAGGSRNALFLLRPYLTVDEFVWDESLRKWDDFPVEYLNDKSGRRGSSQVILVSKPVGERTSAFLGEADSTLFGHDFPMLPDDSLHRSWETSFLGSFRTIDNFLVANEALFASWEQTHSGSGYGESWTMTSHGRMLTSASSGGLSIAYEYYGGSLVRCEVTTPTGVIKESVTTDHLGCIIELSREPENWQSLLP
ncbi:MAG TPA: hypothetical protein VND64_02740 [Pirellulales bacterium]|nr:hypothetical protein [Pirellulales bacterium]